MERKANYPINPLFLKRHSPRAIADKPLEKEKLMSLFEAARWAPSSYNNQPWRYVYSFKGSRVWQGLQALLVPQNRLWTSNAPVIICVLSHNLFQHNNQPSRTHSFDAGSAWENLALQAADMDLVAHAMEGFDYEGVRTYLSIPNMYTVEAMIVVGYPGNIDDLPQDLRKGDLEYTDRMPLENFAFEDTFKLL
ncbi:MAG: nitroreductase family protein [Candidatus Babeliaceae bacterium]|nr:nitroreductase family protein [Candidatus Babeliaceae bacterium]